MQKRIKCFNICHAAVDATNLSGSVRCDRDNDCIETFLIAQSGFTRKVNAMQCSCCTQTFQPTRYLFISCLQFFCFPPYKLIALYYVLWLKFSVDFTIFIISQRHLYPLIFNFKRIHKFVYNFDCVYHIYLKRSNKDDGFFFSFSSTIKEKKNTKIPINRNGMIFCERRRRFVSTNVFWSEFTFE